MINKLHTKTRKALIVLSVFLIVCILAAIVFIINITGAGEIEVIRENPSDPTSVITSIIWKNGSTEYARIERSNNVYYISTDAQMYAAQLFCEGYSSAGMTFQIANSDDITVSATLNSVSFNGLGSETYPFSGALVFSFGTDKDIIIPEGTYLFNYLSSSASLTSSISISGGGLARVLVADSASANYSGINIVIKGAINTTSDDAGAMFGRVIPKNVSAISITLPSVTFPSAITSANGDAGGIIGEIASGVNVTLSGIPASTSYSVNAANGGAGILVGNVSGSLSISDVTLSNSGTVSGTYSGSVAGIVSGSFTQAQTGTLTVSGGTYSGTDSAGGLVGKYSGTGFSLETVSVSGCSVSGKYCGGLVGDGKAFNIDENVTVGLSSARVTVNGTASTGGLVGRINDSTGVCSFSKTDDESSEISVFVSIGGESGGVSGGLIGTVAAKCVTLSGITVNQTNSRTNNNDNGALVGAVSGGSVLDCGSVTLNGSATTKRAIGSTGVKSAVRFSGALVFSGPSAQYIVGTQDNSLIYCEDGWTLTRNTSSPIDDIGNYGQIIRNDNKIEKIISFTDNTVTVAGLSSLSLSSKSDFAKLSIFLTSHGQFGSVKVDSADKTYQEVLSSDISVSGTIDLTETGIEALTRTDTSDDKFSGKMTGSGAANCTITLDFGVVYPDTSASVSRTAGYSSRAYAGLFSCAENAKFSDFTIAGNIYGNTSYNSKTNAGGICGYASGKIINGSARSDSITATGIISNVVIREKGNNKDSQHNYGGFFGSFSGRTLEITGCTSNANITLKHNNDTSSSCTGGFVGSATVSGNANFSGSGFAGIIQGDTDYTYANARVGGFIAVITGTADTEVDLDTVTAGGTVNVKATGTGKSGGLIGYEWNDVNVILGGTATGTLSATGGCGYGGLFYSVKGKLTLNSGFEVSGSFTGTDGGLVVFDGTALYMVVKCADTFSSSATVTGIKDRLAAVNISSRGTGEVASTGGIITIETSGSPDIGEMPASGSGWYSFIKNTNTRYYYNIEQLDKAHTGADGDGEAARLLLWHITNYANTKPLTYFGESKINGFTASADINMSGKCLYPTSASGTYNLGAHTLTFGLPEGGDISNVASQNYAVQTGLLLDVTSGTTTVTNGIILGTVNKLAENGGSGAVVVGTVTGHYDSKNQKGVATTLTVSNIALQNTAKTSYFSVDGANNATYAPMLINTMGEYVTVNLSHITHQGTDVYATSLLGKAGGAGKQDVNIKFDHMILNGEKGASAFSNASFLESIDYAKGSCVYNYDFDEYWTNNTHIKQVTYGREMKDITQYYDESIPVTPSGATAPTSSSSFTDFNTSAYLFYVYQADSDSIVIKISVNIKGGDLLDGYGKYSSPYIITSFSQLYSIARFINTGECDTGWKINYPALHTEFIAESAYTETTVYSSSSAEKTAIRTFLQNAYYQINFSGDDSENFINAQGIGTEAKPFRGVIYGVKDNGVNSSTLTFSAVTGKAGWGLINVADGCVIKDLNIIYSETCTVIENKHYFGGVIGKITGGDNIIDNVSVSAEGKISITSGKRITYTGGYVGIIVSGGVIFRNTVLSSMGIYSVTAENYYDTYYYVNPYVGRVLDGFAVYDGDTVLNNTDKNYYIWNANGSVDGTIIDGTTATLSSGYEMMLFSAALNSGTLSTSGYIARKGTYSSAAGKMGTPVASADVSHTTADYDSAKENNLPNPYLIAKMGSGSRSSGASYTIVLSGNCDVSVYGNGFRGIGKMYSDSYVLTSFSTTSDSIYIIKMNRSIYEYTDDEYHAKGLGVINFAKLTANASIQNITIRGTAVLEQIKSSDGGINSDYDAAVYCGGIIGKLASPDSTLSDFNLTLTKVTCGGATVTAEDNQSMTVGSHGSAGGLIGDSGSKVTIVNCSYNNLKIDSYYNAGGFIGRTDKQIDIHATAETESSNLLIIFKNNMKSDTKDFGAGGFIGFTSGVLNINTSAEDKKITLKNTVIFTTVNSKTQCNEYGLGGVCGILRQSNGTVKKLDIEGIYILGNIYDGSVPATEQSYDEYKISDNVRGFTVTGTGTSDPSTEFINRIKIQLNKNSIGEYANPGIGGVFGSVGVNGTKYNSSLNIEDVSVYATEDNCIVFVGSNNSGGLIGDYRFTGNLIINNCSFNSKSTGPALIIGGTRAAGIVAYMREGSLKINNDGNADSFCTVGNTTGRTDFVSVMQKSSCFSAGVVAEATTNGINISNCTVTNCLITGKGAGGAAGQLRVSPSAFNNITVSDCIMFSKNGDTLGYSGGLIFAIATTASDGKLASVSETVYINDVDIKNNLILAESSDMCGGIVGVTSGGTNNIYGNRIYWEDNTLGIMSFPNNKYAGVLSNNYLSISVTKASNVYVGKNSGGTVNIYILGLSRSDAGLGEGESYAENEGARVVYASYNAESSNEIFEKNSYQYPNDENSYWKSDSFGTTGGVRTATILNDVAWWKTDYSALTQDIIGYRDVGGADYSDVPVFYVDGTDENITKYLNLLTNGGFSEWDYSTSTVGSSQRYNVTAEGVSEIGGDTGTGSATWDSATKSFKTASLYDTVGKLTVISVTFTNKSGSGNNDFISYTIDVAIYFPKTLAYSTNIVPVGHEEYSLAYIRTLVSQPQIAVTAGDLFSLYIEFIYNDVRNGLEINLEKSLRNLSDVMLPKDSELLLIDLNLDMSNDGYEYGKAYSYTLTQASSVIHWNDFTGYENVPLKDIQSFYNCTSDGFNIIGDSSFETSENREGIERYLLIIKIPSDVIESNATARVLDFYAHAAVPQGENITLDCLDDANTQQNKQAKVTIWRNVSVSLNTSARSSEISKNSQVIIDVAANITYPSGYSFTLGGTESRFASISFYLTDDMSKTVELPAGTTVVYSDTTEDLLENSIGDVFTRNYTIAIDFSGVADQAYRDFATASDSYTVNVEYYLTNDLSSKQTGVLGVDDINAALSISNDVPLTVTVTSDTLSLGINKYENETGEIHFKIKADMSNYPYVQGDQLVLKMEMWHKNAESLYVQCAALNGFTLNPGENENIEVTADNGYWYIYINPQQNQKTSEIEYNSDLDIDLVLYVDPVLVDSLTNHRLTAGIYLNNELVSSDDHFIFTVSNIYTQID